MNRKHRNGSLLHSAGLLLTYKCTARCRHCETCSGPSKDGVISIRDADRIVRDLKEVGVRKIHLTGGEPFLYQERLFKVLHLIQDAFGPMCRPEIQTNGFWCTDKGVVETKYNSLEGLCCFVCASIDPFHFEWVPMDRVRRCLNLAATAFDVHNAHFDSDLSDYARNLRLTCSEAIEMEGDYIKYVSNAAFSLAPFVPGHPPETFSQTNCRESLLGGDSIHIDHYGNIVPGDECWGITLGNALQDSGSLRSIIEGSRSGHLRNATIDVLVESGPWGLYLKARELGYEPLARGYATACHLCYMVRTYLFKNGHCIEALGPEELYQPTADETLGPEIVMKEH